MRRSNGWGQSGTLLLIFGITAPAQVFTTLTYFNGSNGGRPYGSLVQGLDGNLYGTTFEAGTHGAGTVFKITTDGALTLLHSFGVADGRNPSAALVLARSGDFYGTTSSGGPTNAGTVFRITPGGALTTSYNFCSQSQCTDGQGPDDALVQTPNGIFYGTTYLGGTSNLGTVFMITPGGARTTMHSFTGGLDGSYPFAGVIHATDGDFYGTTDYGNTVFKITPGGALTTLYQFCLIGPKCSDGSNPMGSLIQATDGNFYGTTFSGGAYSAGTVFRITPAGALTTLYSFCAVPTGAPCTDGDSPRAGLIEATDGNFYGTTESGGSYGLGTVFKVTQSGALTTLHSFQKTGGAEPFGGLLQGTDGSLYGLTSDYGLPGAGTVYRITIGLGPFVQTLPTSGRVGDAVKILGTSLTGATSVTFNGVAATLTVVRLSEITATVPVGATTGSVEVTTPGGTLLSNLPFLVRP
jgi:uncharacterized repeat protein (TIGR03803 family)